MNLPDTIRAARSLPEFSLSVYVAILDGLYAEPGFSDVDAKQLAARVSASVEAINAALGHLYAANLIYSTEADSLDPFTGKANSANSVWIHAEAHDDGLRKDVLEAIR